MFSPSTFSRDKERATPFLVTLLPRSCKCHGRLQRVAVQRFQECSRGCCCQHSKHPLSSLSVSASGPRRVDVQCFIPMDARQKVSSCFPRFIVLFPDLSVLPGCWLAVCRYFLPLIATLGNARLCYGSCFWILAFYIREGGTILLRFTLQSVIRNLFLNDGDARVFLRLCGGLRDSFTLRDGAYLFPGLLAGTCHHRLLLLALAEV